MALFHYLSKLLGIVIPLGNIPIKYRFRKRTYHEISLKMTKIWCISLCPTAVFHDVTVVMYLNRLFCPIFCRYIAWLVEVLA